MDTVAPAMAKKTSPLHRFEQDLQELEGLVAHLEQGDISLEDALKHFARGVELSRACQQALKHAEQQVQILTSRDVSAAPTSDESGDE